MVLGKLSKDKGKRGEREVAELLRSHGFEARRGQQYRGGPGSPDVIHSVPGLHIEVKRAETLRLYDALDQAVDDAKTSETAVVFHRKSNKRWVVILEAEAFLRFMERVPLVSAEGDNCSYVNLGDFSSD